MKKIYVLLLCFLPMLALAQPTITQSDLPVPGTGWISAIDSSYSLGIPPAGNNVAWVWDNLTGINDTTSFVSVTGTPYVAQFPTSTCATYSASNGEWQYFTANSTGFYFNGSNKSPFLKFNPAFLYTPVPFTYNDSCQNTARFVYDTVILSSNYQEITNISSNFIADGWGTLYLPSGAYPNTLREKETDIMYDSALIDTGGGNYVFQNVSIKQQVNYRYLRDDATSPVLLEIDADSAGTTPHRSSYLISPLVLSANEIHDEENTIYTYPNPASNMLHIDTQGKIYISGMIKIYNSLGQEIMKKDINEMNLIDVPVEKLINGIYYYTLISDNYKRSGKFSVVH